MLQGLSAVIGYFINTSLYDLAVVCNPTTPSAVEVNFIGAAGSRSVTQINVASVCFSRTLALLCLFVERFWE